MGTTHTRQREPQFVWGVKHAEKKMICNALIFVTVALVSFVKYGGKKSLNIRNSIRIRQIILFLIYSPCVFPSQSFCWGLLVSVLSSDCCHACSYGLTARIKIKTS